MSKSRVMALIVASVCAVFVLSGCGDYVGKEKSHPLYVKAENCKAGGNYQDAAKYLEEFIAVCPKSARAHGDIASIYADYLNEPLKAVYHYRVYSELIPADSQDAQDVKGFIDASQKQLFAQLKETYKSEDGDPKALMEELNKAKVNLEKYVEYANKLAAQNQEMKKRLSDIAADRKGGSSVKKATGASSSSTSATAPKGATTYKVKTGDTIAKIARAHYGSTNYISLIVNANKGKLGANNSVSVGQELVLPALPAKTPAR